jgi:hypothetical protein
LGSERKLLLFAAFGLIETVQFSGFHAAVVSWFQKAFVQIMICGQWLVKSRLELLSALANTEVAVHE